MTARTASKLTYSIGISFDQHNAVHMAMHAKLLIGYQLWVRVRLSTQSESLRETLH